MKHMLLVWQVIGWVDTGRLHAFMTLLCEGLQAVCMDRSARLGGKAGVRV